MVDCLGYSHAFIQCDLALLLKQGGSDSSLPTSTIPSVAYGCLSGRPLGLADRIEAPSAPICADTAFDRAPRERTECILDVLACRSLGIGVSANHCEKCLLLGEQFEARSIRVRLFYE